MLLGLRTVIYHVNDIAKAKEWYTSLLGFPPYFDQPFYVGFEVGGFELGLDPNMKGVTLGNNTMAYWGVVSLGTELKRALGLGAMLVTDVQDVGEGILVATVLDPFGNVLGLIENPHFKFLE